MPQMRIFTSKRGFGRKFAEVGPAAYFDFLFWRIFANTMRLNIRIRGVSPSA